MSVPSSSSQSSHAISPTPPPPPSSSHTTHSMVTRSKAGIFQPKAYTTATSPDLPVVPKNYKFALENSTWYNSITAEDSALKNRGT